MNVRSTVSSWTTVKSARTGTVSASRATNGNPSAFWRRFRRGFVTEDDLLAVFVGVVSESFSQVNAAKMRVERMVPSGLAYIPLEGRGTRGTG